MRRVSWRRRQREGLPNARAGEYRNGYGSMRLLLCFDDSMVSRVSIAQKDDPNPVPELSNEREAGPCMATCQGSQVALGVPQLTHYQQVSVVSV